MKRLIILLLILHPSSFTLQRLLAQPHVEEAFRALVLEANEGQMPEERLMEGGSDSRFTLTMHQSFTLPAEKYKLITDMYKAMDDDSAMRTQYRLHDAFSGREWRLDIETPHFVLHEQSEESVNNLMGGFFVPEKSPSPIPPRGEGVNTAASLISKDQIQEDKSSSLEHSKPLPREGNGGGVTLYRYYVLSYQEDMEGYLTGSVERITFDADTQEPNIQQPSTPKYQALIDAINAFGADDKVFMRRNLSERRAAATGQWTHIYNTIGFNMPLEDEVRLLGPLWKAFLNEQKHAYRSLNKPAGQVASDVQVVYDEQGHTLGLGLQQDWNITYVYFNDEDFPQNRYVYALWYKADVPRQRIVGELIKINTLRPEGGTVDHPFVQRTVPTYLWKAPLYPAAMGDIVPNPDGDGYKASLYPLYASSPNFAQMQRIVADLPGLDMQPLRFMLDTLLTRRNMERTALDTELRDIEEHYRESLQGLSGMLKLNIKAEDFQRMTPQERKEFNDQARKAYQEELDRVNSMYKEYLSNISRRHPIEDLNIFRRDSVPSDVFRSAFDVLTKAYRGDASERDAQVAERLRQMAEMAADEASRPVRLGMYQKLDSIINLRHPNLPGNMLSPSRQALAEAVMALDVQPTVPQSPATYRATVTKDLKDSKDLKDLKVSRVDPDHVTLTLPNGNSITAGKIRVNPFKGSVLGIPGAKMTVRHGKRMVRRAERRLRRMERRLERGLK
ncbi:MAG: hypothetical protein IJK45_03360 [Bacteroidaceae bacterium]|nr:hypothetical protein [Bacteroidaceae bacterium]